MATRRQTLLVLTAGFFLAKKAFGKTAPTYDALVGLQVVLSTLPLEQRDKLIVEQFMRVGGGVCDAGCFPLKIWVILDGRQIDIPVKNGVLIGPPIANLLGKHLPIIVASSLPAVDMITEIRIKPPPGTQVPVRYFLEALEQINRLIYRFVLHEHGLLAAIFSPNVTRLNIYYGGMLASYSPQMLEKQFLEQRKNGTLVFPAQIASIEVDDL